MDKPKELYRGVAIRYELLETFEYGGYDLAPPNPPSYDSQGRKTVGDGNEYGVYMSDYKNVAELYADPDRSGTNLDVRIRYGYDGQPVELPAVGIVYVIDTEGIDVHIPWITRQLRGHYNNGLIGDEWVCERIPKENYHIDSITIGRDSLHDKEYIPVTDPITIKKTVDTIISKRKQRIELFLQELQKMTPAQRRAIGAEDINIYKMIFKVDGLMDIDINNSSITNGNELLIHIMAYIYKQNPEQIDFKNLRFVYSLIPKTKELLSIEDVKTLLENELYKTILNKEKFIEKKTNEGVEYTTNGFDSKIEMIKHIQTLTSTLLEPQESIIDNQKNGAVEKLFI